MTTVSPLPRLEIVEQRADYGACVYSATIRPHGYRQRPCGVIATMIDMAAVVSVFSNLPDTGSPAGTADLAVTYLRQVWRLGGCRGKGDC